MNIQEVGKNLKVLRTRKGYTQGELAEILNVSHQAVSRWEKGDNLPDVMKLSELAKLYSVSIEELLLEEKYVEKKTKSKVLPTLTILSSVISVLMVILYFSLLDTGIEGWLNILILYILIILNSLLYTLPFSLRKESTTLIDLNYLMLGLSSTLFAIGMTIISVIEGGRVFYIEYLLNGPVFAFILIAINVSVFSIIKNKLFDTNMSFVANFLSQLPIKRWRKIVISFTISTAILLPPLLYGGDFAFLTVLVGAVTIVTLLVLLVTKFNIVTLLLSLFYSYVYGFLCFYVFNEGKMSEQIWETNANLSSFYEDSIGIIAIIVIAGLIVLHWLYKEYLSKHRKSIYISSILFFLQMFSIIFAAPVFGHSRQTSNGVLVHESYHLDLTIHYTIVHQIIILTISIVLFTDLFNTYRNRSLNKGK